MGCSPPSGSLSDFLARFLARARAGHVGHASRLNVLVEIEMVAASIPGIRAARCCSSITKRANSSGVMVIGSMPWLTSHLRTSGSAIAVPMSSERCSTRRGGVPAGAQTPYQIGKSYPATPASAIVGTCGSSGERRAVVTPNAARRPSVMCGAAIEIATSRSRALRRRPRR